MTTYLDAIQRLDRRYHRRCDGLDLASPPKKPTKKIKKRITRNLRSKMYYRALDLGYDGINPAIVDLYVTHEMSTRQIADAFGVKSSAIRYRLLQSDVEMRPRGGVNNLRHGRYAKT